MESYAWNINPVKNLFNKSVRFLFSLLLKPKTGFEDSIRREFILNIILVGSIVLLLMLDFSVLYHSISQGDDYPGVPFLTFSAIPVVFIGLLFLSRIGKVMLSAYLLIFTYLLAITYGAVNWGVDLQPVILSYALVIVISSILISTRAAFIVTLIICAIILPLWYFQIHHIVSVQWYWKNKPQSTDALVFACILFLIMTVSWLSNREIERSLKRARASEAALKAQRDNLEVTVLERTRELHAMQSEKIAQLYRFAEFGRLSSGLFHDLMTPLTSMSLHLGALNETNPQLFNETKGFLNKAFAASKKIDQFAIAVKKQLQHREAIELFSMRDGIGHATDLLAHKAWQNQVVIQFDLVEDVVAYQNPLKFHQIMVNLISNAIDAYDEPEVDLSRPRQVKITLSQDSEMVVILVRDFGAGIANDAVAKIFEPFFSTKPSDKGTGIGLATTKQIVEKELCGSIQVITAIGQGTTFRITIPRSSITAPHNETEIVV